MAESLRVEGRAPARRAMEYAPAEAGMFLADEEAAVVTAVSARRVPDEAAGARAAWTGRWGRDASELPSSCGGEGRPAKLSRLLPSPRRAGSRTARPVFCRLALPAGASRSGLGAVSVSWSLGSRVQESSSLEVDDEGSNSDSSSESCNGGRGTEE